jgi:hypothetical protein
MKIIRFLILIVSVLFTAKLLAATSLGLPLTGNIDPFSIPSPVVN